MATRHLLLALALASLLVGCNGPQAVTMQHLDPASPGGAGLPAAPAWNAPAALAQRPPFGLYAQTPSSDTLSTLASGVLSPDGRYRAAVTGQGLWVARVDGAWLWEVPLAEPPAPAPAPAATTATDAAKTTTPPTPAPLPAKPIKFVGTPQWTPGNTILIQDDTGNWDLANPDRVEIHALPALLQGKESPQFSPDGQQVLYYTAGKAGQQLWVARADGTAAKLMGENVIGNWNASGKLVVTKAVNPKPTSRIPEIP